MTRPDCCDACQKVTHILKYCKKCRRYVCAGGSYNCWAGDAYTGYCINCDARLREEEKLVKITIIGQRIQANGLTCGFVRGEKGNYTVVNAMLEQIGKPFQYHAEATAFAREHFLQSNGE
jgi:hypothetical protein